MINNYKLIDLELEHLTDILSLQSIVVNDLKIKEHFISNDKSYFESILKNENHIFLGIFKDDTLISYALVLLNCNDYKEHFKKFKITPTKFSANFDIIVVHPNFRGNKIHKYLIDVIHKKLIKLNYSEIYCTVHPNNFSSLNNFLDKGYLSLGEITKKENHQRLFLQKILTKK